MLKRILMLSFIFIMQFPIILAMEEESPSYSPQKRQRTDDLQEKIRNCNPQYIAQELKLVKLAQKELAQRISSDSLEKKGKVDSHIDQTETNIKHIEKAFSKNDAIKKIFLDLTKQVFASRDKATNLDILCTFCIIFNSEEFYKEENFIVNQAQENKKVLTALLETIKTYRFDMDILKKSKLAADEKKEVKILKKRDTYGFYEILCRHSNIVNKKIFDAIVCEIPDELFNVKTIQNKSENERKAYCANAKAQTQAITYNALSRGLIEEAMQQPTNVSFPLDDNSQKEFNSTINNEAVKQTCSTILPHKFRPKGCRIIEYYLKKIKFNALQQVVANEIKNQ